MKKVALVTPPTGGILHFVTEDMVQNFVKQHLKVSEFLWFIVFIYRKLILEL